MTSRQAHKYRLVHENDGVNIQPVKKEKRLTGEIHTHGMIYGVFVLVQWFICILRPKVKHCIYNVRVHILAHGSMIWLVEIN